MVYIACDYTNSGIFACKNDIFITYRVLHFCANYNMQIYYLQHMQIITHAKYNDNGINCINEWFFYNHKVPKFQKGGGVRIQHKVHKVPNLQGGWGVGVSVEWTFAQGIPPEQDKSQSAKYLLTKIL